jgi:hypothetical protein
MLQYTNADLCKKKKIDRTEKRLSAISAYSSILTASVFDGAASRARRDDDGGDDSESERTRTVILYRLGCAPRTNGGNSGGRGTVSGNSTACTNPVVRGPRLCHSHMLRYTNADLKKKSSGAPFPLPEIIVDRLQVCCRAVDAQGIARPRSCVRAPVALGRSAGRVTGGVHAH